MPSIEYEITLGQNQYDYLLDVDYTPESCDYGVERSPVWTEAEIDAVGISRNGIDLKGKRFEAVYNKITSEQWDSINEACVEDADNYEPEYEKDDDW